MVATRVHLPMVGPAPASASDLVPRPEARGLRSEVRRSTADSLLDAFARRVRYLRISVTDRCNYRCAYCMPEELADRVAFARRSALLSFEELVRVASVFARLGVRKLRLTGGEPTMRRGLPELVRMLARIPGIERMAMTTNGHVLAELAHPLRDAGLGSVNVSLDTLDPDRFARVTGRGDLARVLAGIDAAVAAGLVVKVNAVAIVGVNDGELSRLCEAAWKRGATPRFIEHMPMSGGALYQAARGISAATIRATIERELGALAPVASDRDAGPARYWRVAGDANRRLGIISAMSEHFCDDCNRLRLTATGELHACLGHDDATNLRDLLRSGASDDYMVTAIARAVAGKRAGHEFGQIAPETHMIGIGG
jgi:cyclic pyranopterin phosphate synthase